MEFEWDEDKNQINWTKHRIDFADAVHVFLDSDRIEREDTGRNYGESRFQTIGSTEFGVLFVVYTERHGDTIRMISARKATKHEKKHYEQSKFLGYTAGGW